MKTVVIIISVAFAFARPFMPPHLDLSGPTVYKDFAHVVVGTVFGMAMVSKDRDYWLTFAGLCVVEVATAAFMRLT